MERSANFTDAKSVEKSDQSFKVCSKWSLTDLLFAVKH